MSRESTEYGDDLPIWHLNHDEHRAEETSSDSSEIITAMHDSPAPHTAHARRRSPETEVARPVERIFWIRWICGWPKLTFSVTLLIQISFVVITAILYTSGYPIFPAAFDDMPMENIKSLEYRRFLAWRNIFNKDQPVYTFMRSRRKRDTSASVNKYKMDERFQIFYQLPHGRNILTQKYLQQIQRFESIVSTALTTPFDDSGIHLSQSKQSVLAAFNDNLTQIIPSRYDYLLNYLDKSGTINKTSRTAVSSLTRSDFFVLYYGNEEWELLMDYFQDVLSPKIMDAVDAVFDDVQVYVWNFPMYGQALKRQVFKDMYLFIGSVLFIFLFILVQTASFFITFFGTASIVVSFLGANLIYDCIIGYKYFGIFNVLALFIVLGLGADDIFIFLDTWKNLDNKGLSMEERMEQTYRTAVLAMFNTSLTTMVAFMVNAFAALLPIRTFGLFAGLTVAVNFMSVVVFFPTVVAVHHRHFENCCRRRISSPARSANFISSSDDLTPRCEARESVCSRLHQKVALFFGLKYFKFVTHKVVKWVILALFVILLTGMSVSLSRLKVDETPAVQLFVSGNKYEKARHLKEQGFKKNLNDIPVSVLMIWGLKPRDMTSCDPRYYKPYHPCPGIGQFDDKFELEKNVNQLAMKEFCRDLDRAQEGRPRLMINKYVCLIDQFESTLKSFANVSLPITSSKIARIRSTLTAGLGIQMNDNLQTPFTTLLYLWSQRAQIPNNMFGFTQLDPNSQPVGKMQGVPFYNMRLKWMVGAEVTTSLTVFDFSVDRGFSLMSEYEAFMREESGKMPVGLDDGFQTSNFWYQLRDRLQIVEQGKLGVGISLALAFLLILLATQNLLLSLLAVLTLASAVVCVLGVMPIAGWSLGILEGLNMAFVAGLSVDYILHLVQAYRHSKHRHRADRTQEALHSVGVSVVSGALTTLGSSAFIMFSQIEFFLEFGVFIFCTVGFSVLHAMLLFPALLTICGPSNNQGHLCFFCHNTKTNEQDPSEDRDYILINDQLGPV